jgi:5'-phosphate synthase pdxT subunit
LNKTIGVLAIQGDFQAHLEVLSLLGVTGREVRNSSDLQGVTHLIVPGGESTTIRKVAQIDGLWDKLVDFRGPVMGTCMGSILMAKTILSPDAGGWGMLDMTIQRNAYGRQIDSFTARGRIAFLDHDFEMVFIRAPRIVRYGEGVKPLAWLGDEVTGVIAENKIALTFHPELSGSSSLHEYFLGLVAAESPARPGTRAGL